jgi:DNA-binding Lrp family transcriptional regulator
METQDYQVKTEEYAKCIEGSKRIRWDIDKDVLRGREFDFSKKFLPDGISRIDQVNFLDPEEKKLLSQVQGRTYANMFGFVERFIVAKILEITRYHWLGDQVALEALVRFSDEELKHQELFRRIEKMMGSGMPEGYKFQWDPNEVAGAVLSKSTWAVMALIYEIELFTQEHYKKSIEPDENLSELYKDIFLYHWKEEAHHAYLDSLEWPREDSRLTPIERERGIDEVIELVGAVDGILQEQSRSDADYFLKTCRRSFTEEQIGSIKACLLKAYRWQYIFSGVEHPRFQKLLRSLITEAQFQKIAQALGPLVNSNDQPEEWA